MASGQNNRSNIDVAIEVFECRACGSDPGYPRCRRPGNSLEGQVIISTKSTLQFTCLEVLFQGLQSANIPVYSWEDDYSVVLPSASHPIDHLVIVRAKDLFLDIKYGGSLHCVRQRDRENGLKQYSFAFSFVIPFEHLHDNKPSLCCKLPPSFDTARLGPTRWNESPPPVLSVTYNLHARVHYHEREDTTPRHVEAKEAITLLPYSEVEPPTHTEHFPGEFVLRETTTVWKHALGGRLGVVVVSACEPPPLIYSSSTSVVSTDCTVSITVRPVSLPQGRLQDLSFDITPAIRAKTFYSAKAMPCIPRQADLARKALIRLHDEVTNLEEHRFSKLEWEYTPPSVIEGTPPAYEALMTEDGRSSVSSGSGTSVRKQQIAIRSTWLKWHSQWSS